MNSFTRAFFVSQIKRRITSGTTQGIEPLDKLVKYIKIMCRRHGITLRDLHKILIENRRKSVESFLDTLGILYQLERLLIFKKLYREL